MTVTIYTDGACSGNPGPGGYAAILTYGDYEKIVVGGEAATTNNRMELTAVLEGIRALKKPCNIEIVSDSNYVVGAINEWFAFWSAHGWRTKNRKPIENLDLWKQYQALLPKVSKITAVKVAGHTGHVYNERCDELAVAERDKRKLQQEIIEV